MAASRSLQGAQHPNARRQLRRYSQARDTTERPARPRAGIWEGIGDRWPRRSEALHRKGTIIFHASCVSEMRPQLRGTRSAHVLVQLEARMVSALFRHRIVVL